MQSCIARRDKKAFLSEQCKEVKENSRMERTKDPFKKIGNIKGTFHARMGVMKDRNGKEQTGAERLRGGKNTQKNCTEKVLMTGITNIVWSSLRTRHLECEVKWAAS